MATPLGGKKKKANGHSGAKEFYHQQNFMRLFGCLKEAATGAT